jgi:hypothetical protein
VGHTRNCLSRCEFAYPNHTRVQAPVRAAMRALLALSLSHGYVCVQGDAGGRSGALGQAGRRVACTGDPYKYGNEK